MASFITEGLPTWAEVLIILYLVLVTTLNVYQLHKFVSILRAIRGTRFFTDKPKAGGLIPQDCEPVVTVQICVYNEAAVVQKTIDKACQVDWPKDKLFVQVLDDSTDQTSDIIEKAAAEWRAKGVNCHRLTRPTRTGYKAGNLADHMSDVQGEFVAVFDSDHRCESQYLRRAIPQFFKEDGTSDDKIGLVQTPWAYYNTHQNLLTEYESLTLDYSHVVDQISRASALKCFGFNGTGGVWRKAAIEDAGGWKWDTVTEDMDISYLAHLAGYDFVYLRDVPQQLEIPSGIRAHRKQKHRWTKGYMQVLRKRLWKILKSPKASLALKIEAFFHMTMGLNYLFVMFLFILIPIITSFGGFTLGITLYGGVLPLFVHLSGIILTICAKVPSSNGHYKTFWSRTKRLLVIPVQLCFAMGMTVFETVAALDGLFSNDATFYRTPKEGSQELSLYLDEDEDEVEDEVVDVGGNDVEQGADAMWEGEKQENHRKGNKLSPFVAHILEGLIGVFLACYLIAWVPILFVNGLSRNYALPSLILTMISIVPIIGLLYMHLQFLAATFTSHYRARKKKLQAEADTEIDTDPNSSDNSHTLKNETDSNINDTSHTSDDSDTNTSVDFESDTNRV